MYTQIIVANESPAQVVIPKELVGHTLRISIEDEGVMGTKDLKSGAPSTVEEILSRFRAIQIDTKGFKFDREEANRR